MASLHAGHAKSTTKRPMGCWRRNFNPDPNVRNANQNRRSTSAASRRNRQAIFVLGFKVIGVSPPPHPPLPAPWGGEGSVINYSAASAYASSGAHVQIR